MATLCVEAASQSYLEGVGVTVVDPRWVKPLPKEIATMANRYKSVVVVEDGIKHGGIASTLSEMFREEGITTPIHSIGVPLTFLEHAKRNEILADLGITAQQISRELVAWNSSHVSTLEKQVQVDESENRKPLR
jgi:1-deoxy-D-xylulose-5-phosphate synthase